MTTIINSETTSNVDINNTLPSNVNITNTITSNVNITNTITSNVDSIDNVDSINNILKLMDNGNIFNIKISDIYLLKNKSKYYNMYISDFINTINNLPAENKAKVLNSSINLKFGDDTNSYDSIYFSKASKLNDPNCVLLPLNINRHYGNIKHIINNDIVDFNFKKPIIFWRGATTNYGYNLYDNIKLIDNPRLYIIKKYYDNPLFDIGFTKLCQGVSNYDYINKYIKDNVSINKMLEYKYLLSLEGNDVATNLKWILSSNSICFMPKPTKITYFREDLLKPDVNYVEITEDNIESKYEYCENNINYCLNIIKNNKELMNKFINKNLYKEGAKLLETTLT
jgi:hypothetical protein